MNSTAEWISRSVSRLRAAPCRQGGAKGPEKLARASVDKSGVTDVVPKVAAPRSTHERLQATLRRGQEVLSPRALRRLHTDLASRGGPQVSELEGGRRAQAVAEWYATAESWKSAATCGCCCASSLRPTPPNSNRPASATRPPQARPKKGRPKSRCAVRWCRRARGCCSGLRCSRWHALLVDMRAELLPCSKATSACWRSMPSWSSCSPPGLTWRFGAAPPSWDSPASLIEKLIKYEAVHDIRSWADLKNRLDSDRRCYGFFHPGCPTSR